MDFGASLGTEKAVMGDFFCCATCFPVIAFGAGAAFATGLLAGRRAGVGRFETVLAAVFLTTVARFLLAAAAGFFLIGFLAAAFLAGAAFFRVVRETGFFVAASFFFLAGAARFTGFLATTFDFFLLAMARFLPRPDE